MKEVTIRGQRVPSLMQGCMRISNLSEAQVDALLHFDLEHGINFFDHADIYGGEGVCETIFGNVLKKQPALSLIHICR